MTNRLILCGLALAAALAADCVDGARNTTPEEQAFQAEVAATLRASLPPAPAGWTLDDRGLLAPAKSVCTGTDSSRVAYSVSYTWMDAVKEQNKRSDEMQKKVAALRALPPEKITEMNEFAKQARALQRELPKARAAANQAEVDRINAEIKELNTKAYAIKQAHMDSVMPQIMAITNEYTAAEAGKTYRVSLALYANDTVEPGLKPGGAILRQGDQSSMMFGQPKTKGAKALKVHSITARFHGDAAQIDSIAKGWKPEPALALLQGNTPQGKPAASAATGQ